MKFFEQKKQFFRLRKQPVFIFQLLYFAGLKLCVFNLFYCYFISF